MRNNRGESAGSFTGTIEKIRAVEDCIRATRKYTEGVHTRATKYPIQGAEFASKKFYKYYEVTPEIEVGWDMPLGKAVGWIAGETPIINVTFGYDYRTDKAEMQVDGGDEVVAQLCDAVPGMVLTLSNCCDDPFAWFERIVAIQDANGKARLRRKTAGLNIKRSEA